MDPVKRAFRTVKREQFLPDELRNEATSDAPLPIGFGQTNSQPTVVEMMLEWLEAEPGQTVLDVGSGSGWTTALLSRIVEPGGRVFAVEKIPELVERGRRNNRAAGIQNSLFYKAGAEVGLPQHGPYDRILVSADANSLPPGLIKQLKPGGKMVLPVQGDVLELVKEDEDKLDITRHRGFAFVPLT